MIRNHWIWHPICYDIAMIASRPLATGSDIVATPTKVPPKGKGNLAKQKLMARWMWISGNAMRSTGVWMSQWSFLEKRVLQWCKVGVHICAYLAMDLVAIHCKSSVGDVWGFSFVPGALPGTARRIKTLNSSVLNGLNQWIWVNKNRKQQNKDQSWSTNIKSMKCFAKSARFEHVHPRKNWCFSPRQRKGQGSRSNRSRSDGI